MAPLNGDKGFSNTRIPGQGYVHNDFYTTQCICEVAIFDVK